MGANGNRSAATGPVRVLCLIKGLGRGGAELLLEAQVRAGDRAQVDYHVAYLSPHKDALVGELAEVGSPPTCLRATSSADLGWLPRLRRLVVEQRIEVIHVHSPVAAAGARLVARSLAGRRRPQVMTTEHNMWQTHVRATRAADRATAWLDDAHLAVSEAVRASLPARLRRHTEVIRHGIDTAAVVSQRAERAAVREELALGDDELVVGTVANLRLTKGWPDLLQAARAVLDAVDGVTFLAVGQGPMEEEIRALHRRLELGDRFRLLGFRPDAVRLMAGCDVFCLASHHEGLPVAVMEAMALGLPVVATDVGGLSELVTDGLHGRLVRPHRPDLLAGALRDLLTDGAARQAAAAAAADAGAALSAERSIERMESIYRALAGR